MKTLLPFAFLFVSIMSYSQVNRYSQPVQPARYQPLSYDELSVAAMSLQKKYEANQKYLYELKNWILELKTQIQEKDFIGRLDGEYSVLTSMEDDDLARATKALKQRENSIREIVSEYNVWVNKNNSKNQNSSNDSQNNSTRNYIQLGIENYQNKDYASAVRNFSKHLETDENNTDIIFYRALAKSELGDRYGAISDYEKIMELNSNYPLKYAKLATVYNNKAYSLVLLGKHKEALPFVEKALEMDKSEWFIWDTRGEINLVLGNYEKSISDLKTKLLA
ncbi:MAG: tetratricopeptide repeat protein [Gelidibacter sp.]